MSEPTEKQGQPRRESVDATIVRGSLWMIGLRWVTKLSGLVSTLILARILSIEDFGIVAMAMILVSFLETFAYAGVDLQLMRNKVNSRAQLNTAWTIQVLQSLAIAVLIVAAAPSAGYFISDPRAVLVVQVLALKSVIDGFTNIGIVAFRKELDFAKEFRFGLYTRLITLVIQIGAALIMRNYWGLVVGLIGGTLVTVLMSYLMHPYRPWFSLAARGQFLNFSVWLIIARLGSFLNQKTDAVIAGSSGGAAGIGVYHVAQELSTLPAHEVVMPVRRALFPALSAVSQDGTALRRTVRTSFGAVAAWCLASGFGLVAVADELVPVLLGPNWIAAIPLMKLLALYGAASGICLLAEVLLWLSGRTNWSAFQNWAEWSVLLPALYVAVNMGGIEAVAAARLAVSILAVFCILILASRAAKIPFSEFVGPLLRPTIAAGTMALVITAIPHWYVTNLLLILIAKVLLGAVIFTVGLCLAWVVSGKPDGFERTALTTLRAKLDARAKRGGS